MSLLETLKSRAEAEIKRVTGYSISFSKIEPPKYKKIEDVYIEIVNDLKGLPNYEPS